eukprot:6480362-Amphidinium_carterae.1
MEGTDGSPVADYSVCCNFCDTLMAGLRTCSRGWSQPTLPLWRSCPELSSAQQNGRFSISVLPAPCSEIFTFGLEGSQ